MKKIIAVSLLIVLSYGFTYRSICKHCEAKKLQHWENKNERHSSIDGDNNEMNFHPLMFVAIPFK
jgi:hypothetical protein